MINIKTDEHLTDDLAYKYVEDNITEINKKLTSPKKLKLKKGVLSFTEFGKNFAKAVGIIK